MSTLTKAKAPVRKPAARRVAVSRRVTLTPPPGLTAAEFLKNLPPPSKDFDAAFVAKVVAARSDR